MSLGDLLEWVTAGLATSAAALWFGLPAALLVAAAALFYLAQGLANVPVPRRRKKQQPS